MRVWHFLRTNGHLRDGRQPPPDGEWLVHDGTIEICVAGLHGSKRPLDALGFAPGSIVCRCELVGDLEHQDDKAVGRRRRILWRYDASGVVVHFARLCALDVLHLWDPPGVVRRFLKTGDPQLAREAWDAAGARPRAAAAWDGGGWDAAAWGAWDAAAWDARYAAWYAARAAWAAARAAARAAAAWDAAWDAARAAARAARDAARDGAWVRQNRRLQRMLTRGRR